MKFKVQKGRNKTPVLAKKQTQSITPIKQVERSSSAKKAPDE